MSLSPITPESTPRQVIPFGDRPIVDPISGRPTPEFYQWCNRVSTGLVTTITNVSTTINETNVITETVNTIVVDVSGIEAEIASIETQIGVLQGEIAAAQFNVENVPPPSPPPRWFGGADFIELEAGANPTKISAMADVDLTTTVDSTIKLAAEQTASINLGIELASLYRVFAAEGSYFAVNPLDGTVSNPGGDAVSFFAGAAFAGSNLGGEPAQFIGGAGDGSGAGGNANHIAGNGGDTGNGGDLNILAGAGGSVSGNGGALTLRAGDSQAGGGTGGTTQFIGGTGGDTGPGGDLFLNAGDGGATSGNGGQLGIFSGSPQGTGDSGAAQLASGGAGTGNTGSVQVSSGVVNTSGDTGDAFLSSGDNAGTGNTGGAGIITGNATGGDSGNINLITGTATGTRGSIVVDAFTITSPAGMYLQLQTGDETVAATNSQDFFMFTGAPGMGGNSGQGNFGTGDAPSGGNSGDIFFYSGNSSSGDSGAVHITTGTAGATRGNVILDALLVVLAGLPTVAPATSGAVWRDAGAGNVLKAVP